MAGKVVKKSNETPLIVLFVEGDTDLVFFNALLQYYRSVSKTPIRAAEVVNMQGVTRYASKMMNKLQNEIMPLARQKGRRVQAVCCSYDTDVFEQGKQIVDWKQVEKNVKRLGVSAFCILGVQSMMEDWLLDDLNGLCTYLKLKQAPTSLSGKTGYEKLVSLFAKGGLKYTKGISASTFMPMIDMSIIREKRKEALKELEEALGVDI